VFVDQVVATAILDRLPHHSHRQPHHGHRLPSRGDSYRLREKRRGIQRGTPDQAVQVLPKTPTPAINHPPMKHRSMSR
jgi:hypothetical protein